MFPAVDLQQPLNRSSRKVEVEYPRDGLRFTGCRHWLYDIRNPTGAHQSTDQLSFVIADGQLSQRAAASADDHHDVTAANVDDFPTHHPVAGKDQHIVRQFIRQYN